MNFHRNMGGYGVTAIIRDKRYNYHLHSVCTPFFLNKQNAQNRRKLHTKKKHSALACLRPAPSHLVARNGLFSKHSASLEHREENIKKTRGLKRRRLIVQQTIATILDVHMAIWPMAVTLCVLNSTQRTMRHKTWSGR